MSYESDSPSDRLTAVRAAISAVLSGQEYQLGSRRLKRADLASLEKLELRLMREVDESSGVLGASVVQVDPFI